MDLKHIHPDDITAEGVRLPRFVIRLVQTREPADQFRRLVDNYPDAIPFAVKDEPIPLSMIEGWPEPDEEWLSGPTYVEMLTLLKEIAHIAQHKPNPDGYYCDCACCKARKLLGVPATTLIYDPS